MNKSKSNEQRVWHMEPDCPHPNLEPGCPHPGSGGQSPKCTPTLSNITSATLETILRYSWMAFILFIVHVTFTLFHFYARWKVLDIPLHFFGGLSIAYLVAGSIIVFAKHKLINRPDEIIRYTLIFSLTCTAAIFWEFAEWTLDHTITSDCQLGRDDTMLDLFLGTLGGSALILYQIIKTFRVRPRN